MRIQHNITAMSAYRNYTNNNSALSKNLEKLSSGYKINRAGDNAAGLAISEKMRAQISGLEQAQSNAKDGISLVQTAEGALTEVHDMLNRMVTLAEQSANGTYDDSVDRDQLQKEMNQLRTEINRIADSSNFNGIKLLDGSLAGTEAVPAQSKTVSGTYLGADRILSDDIDIDANEKPYDVAGTKNIYDTTSPTATVAKFEIDLGQMTFKANVKTTGTIATGAKVAQATKAFVDNTFTIKIAGKTVTVGGVGSGSVGAIKVTGTFKSETLASAATAAQTGVDITGKGSVTAETIAKAVIEKMADKVGATSATATINGVKWTVTQTNGKLSFEQEEVAENWEKARANFDVKITVSATTSGTTLKMSDSIPAGTKVVQQGVPEGAAARANTVFEVKTSDIVDGSKITVGNKTFVLKVGADSTAKAENGEIAVDLTAMDAENVDLNRALNAICDAANGTFTVTKNYVDKNGNTQPGTFNFALTVSDKSQSFPAGLAIQRTTAIGTSGSALPAAFKQKEDLEDIFKVTYNATIKTKEVKGTGGLTLQIGDTSDSYNQLQVSIKDCHCKAMVYDVSKIDTSKMSDEEKKTVNAAAGQSLADVSISTQSRAQVAMTVIKNAINYVSDVRGTLGATQNRLDHTINNLSVMRENIQDAESTIRDTDIAEEMMAYTKNNILVQSAQAMLAQANQLPQGVLQLLQ